MTAPNQSALEAQPCELVLTDVDGTLVTPDKALTPAAVAAVGALRDADIRFAVTSGRPPWGMEMLVGPLALDTPIAAFNGGMFVDDHMRVGESRTLPEALLPDIVEHLDASGLDVWLYCGADWFLRDVDAPHVAGEADTVEFAPTVVADLGEVVAGAMAEGGPGIVKITGVSDDHDLVARTEASARERFGAEVSAARSQDYYLDVTHPAANKGGVVEHLSALYGIAPEAIVVLGDMPNDVLMFAKAGVSIAMGNADREVQRAARHVAPSNERDGFAEAVHRFILPTQDH